MENRQSTSKGFTILGFAGIINKVLAVLYVPALTLIIGDAGNGIYNAGYYVYTLIFVVTNSAIPVAMSKLVSEELSLGDYPASYRTLRLSTTMLVILGLVASILTALLAAPFSRLIGFPRAYLTILALSPTLFFTAVSSAFRGFFQGRSNMLPTGVSQVVEQFINSILTVVFAWLMMGYGQSYARAQGITDPGAIYNTALDFGAAGATVGTSLGAMASAIYLVWRYYKSKPEILAEVNSIPRNTTTSYPPKKVVKRLWEYALPISIGSIAIYSANLIDIALMKTRLEAGGFSEMAATAMYGIFSTQYLKVIWIPLALSTALSAAIIPNISASFTTGNMRALNRTINQSFKLILMVTIPAAVGLIALAEPVITLLFPKNVSGMDLMMMGSWVLIFISVVSVQAAVLQAAGKSYLPTIHLVIGLVLKIVINYTLIAIPWINIRGAIIGTGTAYIFTCIMNHRSIKKHTGARINHRVIVNRPLIASIVMGVVAFGSYFALDALLGLAIPKGYLRNLIGSMIAISAAGIVYFSAMVALRGITTEDLLRLPMGGRINRIVKTKTPLGRLLVEK